MKSLALVFLSFVMLGLDAQAAGFCNITSTLYVPNLPYDSRNQVQTIKKYPVTTWRECYSRGIVAAGQQEFSQTIQVCQEDGSNCLSLPGSLFVGWFFWSDQSLVTVEGQVTRYTSQFDRKEINRGDRRFFPDGSMFP